MRTRVTHGHGLSWWMSKLWRVPFGTNSVTIESSCVCVLWWIPIQRTMLGCRRVLVRFNRWSFQRSWKKRKWTGDYSLHYLNLFKWYFKETINKNVERNDELLGLGGYYLMQEIFYNAIFGVVQLFDSNRRCNKLPLVYLVLVLLKRNLCCYLLSQKRLCRSPCRGAIYQHQLPNFLLLPRRDRSEGVGGCRLLRSQTRAPMGVPHPPALLVSQRTDDNRTGSRKTWKRTWSKKKKKERLQRYIVCSIKPDCALVRFCIMQLQPGYHKILMRLRCIPKDWATQI